MSRWTVPTISGIQRTTALMALAIAALLWLRGSPAVALGCLLGAALMIANLYALELIAHAVFAIARQAGGAHQLGVIAAPLKMFVLVAAVYLIIESGRVNLPGFIAGTLTQFGAIFIETWRASSRGAAPCPEGQKLGAG
ncbi:MAG TPA: ATP synthase subunit I [Candidatus Binataceae bacterium]|nr:ATP synthase subunit I [Candidatus Binataceae bacterium]